MAYIVNKFDGSLIATVQDGTVDQTTNLRFMMRQYSSADDYKPNKKKPSRIFSMLRTYLFSLDFTIKMQLIIHIS